MTAVLESSGLAKKYGVSRQTLYDYIGKEAD